MWLLRDEGDSRAEVDLGNNMMVELKVGKEERASTDAGVVLEVPTVCSGVDPHPGVKSNCFFCVYNKENITEN